MFFFIKFFIFSGGSYNISVLANPARGLLVSVSGGTITGFFSESVCFFSDRGERFRFGDNVTCVSSWLE
jgi:hypothetical protein